MSDRTGSKPTNHIWGPAMQNAEDYFRENPPPHVKREDRWLTSPEFRNARAAYRRRINGRTKGDH